MNRRTKIGIGAAGVFVLAAVGTGIGYADEPQITGPPADQARAAAVKAVPGSTAGEVEAETNEGAAMYGVIVTKSDGTKLEVHLDKNYHFLGTEAPDKTTMGTDRHSRTGHSTACRARRPGSAGGRLSRRGVGAHIVRHLFPTPRCPITYATVATSFVWMS